MTEPLEMPAGEHRDLEVEIDAQIARGLYSNVVLVSRSRTEVTLDFAYAQPDNRVVVQPGFGKLVVRDREQPGSAHHEEAANAFTASGAEVRYKNRLQIARSTFAGS